MSTSVEKGAHIFAQGLAAKAPNSEMGEENVGFEFSPLQCPPPLLPLPITLEYGFPDLIFFTSSESVLESHLHCLLQLS